MGFKFHGKDFQAWADFELDVEGLTVLIGPSNEGKSSLHRALKGLVRNELGQHFVREQGEKMDLTLEIDGHIVNATRTKKGSTVYTVDGNKFEKLNQAIPEDVQKLGLGDLQIADTTLDPVFASQADPRQFMLQETPMVLNAILGRFSSTERLEAGKREANTRIAEKNSEAKTIAKQIRESEELKAKLAALSGRATEIMDEATALAPEIQMLEGRVAELDLLIERQTQHERLLSLIQRLPVITTRDIERKLLVLVSTGELHTATARLLDLRRIAKRLVIPNVDLAVAQADIVEQAGILAFSQQALSLNRQWFQKADATIAVWTNIVAAYNLQKAIAATLSLMTADAAGKAREQAQHLGDMHRDLSAAYDAANALLVRLDTIRVVETRVNRLSEISAQLASCQEQLTAAHMQQGAIETELESDRIRLEQERAQLVADALLCPHCGLEINTKPGETHEHSSPIAAHA